MKHQHHSGNTSRFQGSFIHIIKLRTSRKHTIENVLYVTSAIAIAAGLNPKSILKTAALFPVYSPVTYPLAHGSLISSHPSSGLYAVTPSESIVCPAVMPSHAQYPPKPSLMVLPPLTGFKGYCVFGVVQERACDPIAGDFKDGGGAVGGVASISVSNDKPIVFCN